MAARDLARVHGHPGALGALATGSARRARKGDEHLIVHLERPGRVGGLRDELLMEQHPAFALVDGVEAHSQVQRSVRRQRRVHHGGAPHVERPAHGIGQAAKRSHGRGEAPLWMKIKRERSSPRVRITAGPPDHILDETPGPRRDLQAEIGARHGGGGTRWEPTPKLNAQQLTPHRGDDGGLVSKVIQR